MPDHVGNTPRSQERQVGMSASSGIMSPRPLTGRRTSATVFLTSRDWVPDLDAPAAFIYTTMQDERVRRVCDGANVTPELPADHGERRTCAIG